jgi:glycerophosphoryl diester phosphodiesterase
MNSETTSATLARRARRPGTRERAARRFRIFAFALATTASCESAPDASIPTFGDGGLLRQGIPLSRDSLFAFEGFFETQQGGGLLGDSASVRTSPGTVSVLTDENAGFALLGAACLPDRRLVVEGYWQYPTQVEAGLVRLFVEPPSFAAALCDGAVPEPTPELRLAGSYGHGQEFPTKPLTLAWSRALKPWRGRFFTVAHHGACENTDHCGVSPNSIETIRLAERIGSNAAEVDVRLTRDGIPILFHDPGLSSSLVRGLFCNGAIDELSLAELRANCSLRYGETIPTVQEVLAAIIDETEMEGVYLDIKVPDAVLPTARIVSAVLDELDQRASVNPSDVRQIGIVVAIPKVEVLDAWHEAVRVLQEEGRRVPACLIEYDPDLVLQEGCVAWGPTWTEGPQAENVRKVRAGGGVTVFWTINQSEFIDEFLTQAQPNGIITARASLLFHRYQKIGVPPPLPGEAQ